MISFVLYTYQKKCLIGMFSECTQSGFDFAASVVIDQAIYICTMLFSLSSELY